MAETAVPREDLAALLRWYVDQGLDESVGEEAVDRFAAPQPALVAPTAQPVRAPTPLRAPPPLPRAPVPLESPPLVEDARQLGERCYTFAELDAAVRALG